MTQVKKSLADEQVKFWINKINLIQKTNEKKYFEANGLEKYKWAEDILYVMTEYETLRELIVNKEIPMDRVDYISDSLIQIVVRGKYKK